jgi:hypothetical protein
MEEEKMATIEQISQIQSKFQPKQMKKMYVIGVGIGFKETKGRQQINSV